MKVSTLVFTLVSMMPSVMAGKPEHVCRGDNAPSLSLGGYDVLVSDFPDPVDMIGSLWEKELLGNSMTITPYLNFDSSSLADGKGTFSNFAFEEMGGYWRGVGVNNTEDPNPEISGNEAICVNFGGLAVKQLFFGTRAHFANRTERPRYEQGYVFIYRDDDTVIKHKFIMADDGLDIGIDDGQEHFYIESMEAFDTICFVTRSNELSALHTPRDGHDYFLEYIDLCSSTGKPENICDISGSEPNFLLGGYNVPVAAYPTGLDMVDSLWKKTLANQFEVEIRPSGPFRVHRPLEKLGDDSGFGFEQKDGMYWRGVGVNISGAEQIDDREGIYIHFGGLAIKEIFLGTRDHFPRVIPILNHSEAGRVFLYYNGQPVNTSTAIIANDFWDVDDGQEHFHITSAQEFDSIIVTASLQQGDIRGDFFLEYVDLCCAPDASVKGDPHIQTWTGMKYDYHGVCDLVLLQNPNFQQGLGMDIHVRTKQLKQFSYVSSAVLQIGDETLEVMGDNHENLYWINKDASGSLEKGISGYPISYHKVNSKQHEFVVDLGGQKSIVIKTFKKFVRVNIVGATKESFGTSGGLLGSFHSGAMVGRDHQTILGDVNVFGQEWQVLPADGILFHNVEGPQAPEKCHIPVASNLRRRLAESKISEEEAKMACARVNPEDFDVCVFDVMATCDKDVIGAY
jgi:hypothetical protein